MRRLAVLSAVFVAACGSGGAVAPPPPPPPPPVATVLVTLASNFLTPGGSTLASAVTTDASGHVLVGRVVSWSSDNSVVAGVNTSGLVTALTTGTATILATSEGRIGSALLTVQPVAVATIDVTLALTAIAEGATTTATATAKDADGNVLAGQSITWSSSSTAVARVNQAGLITAVSAGQTTITAVHGTASGQAILVVTQ